MVAPVAEASAAAAPAAAPKAEGGDKKLKPCCACPETKKARDVCILENGEDKCGNLIEKHKECMRSHGFQV